MRDGSSLADASAGSGVNRARAWAARGAHVRGGFASPGAKDHGYRAAPTI
jgi:hypothetical protein